jgi:hypothetical protein
LLRAIGNGISGVSTVKTEGADSPCFLWMQFESALAEPRFEFPQYQLRLHLASAVDNPVVGVAAKADATHLSAHPRIQSVVQK